MKPVVPDHTTSNSKQTILSKFRALQLLVCCVGLALLAFVPATKLGDTLFLHAQEYQDILLNSLHFPGVWIFYHALHQVLKRRQSIVIVLFAIFAVEIVQLGFGREASLLDVVIGMLGLISSAGVTFRQRFFSFSCWVGFFAVLLLLRAQVVTSFPNMANFDLAGVRSHWQPIISDETTNSELVYFNKQASKNLEAPKINTQAASTSQKKTTWLRVIKTRNEYWGARTSVKRTQTQKQQKLKTLKLCGRSRHVLKLLIRMDDRRGATYQERLNLFVPLTENEQCYTLNLTQAIQKLEENGTHFDTSQLLNLAVFAGPTENKNDWFEIYSLEFY